MLDKYIRLYFVRCHMRDKNGDHNEEKRFLKMPTFRLSYWPFFFYSSFSDVKKRDCQWTRT